MDIHYNIPVDSSRSQSKNLIIESIDNNQT